MQLDLRGSIPSFIHISHGKLHDQSTCLTCWCRKQAPLTHGPRLHPSNACTPCIKPAPSSSPRQEELPLPRLYSASTAERSASIAINPKPRSIPRSQRRIRSRVRIRQDARVSHQPDHRCAQRVVCRWQVELFFKWVKQHLRVKRFLGVSENAVKSQLWIAVSVYVLVAILRKRLQIDTPLYTMLQILSVMPFEQVPLYEALTMTRHSFGNAVAAIRLMTGQSAPNSFMKRDSILYETRLNYSLSPA